MNYNAVIQGEMYHKIGELISDGTEISKLCSLYATDSINTELELSIRLADINYARTNREVLCNILGILQNVVRNKNRHVHDFKMICEI